MNECINSSSDQNQNIVWSVSSDKKTAICILCSDGISRELRNLPRHEKTTSHKTALEFDKRRQHHEADVERQRPIAESSTFNRASNAQTPYTSNADTHYLSTLAVSNLLGSLAGDKQPTPYVLHGYQSASHIDSPVDADNNHYRGPMDWGVYDSEDEEPELPPEAEAVRQISRAILEGWDAVPVDSSGSEEGDSDERPDTPTDTGLSGA
jgi:hypothetical protein